jgi:hypothetical protein
MNIINVDKSNITEWVELSVKLFPATRRSRRSKMGICWRTYQNGF